MKRYECLRAMLEFVGEEDLVVTNLGRVRDEWHALRPGEGNYHVFVLGLCSSVALGLSLALPHRRVIVLDSDGSLLVNLPTLTTIADQNPDNLVHIVFDNQAYESAGGGRTHTANRADLALIARGAGFENAVGVDSLDAFRAAAQEALSGRELSFIAAKVELASEVVAPNPFDAMESTYRFMRHLEKLEGKDLLTLAPPTYAIPAHLGWARR